MFFTISSAFAEFERAIIRERQAEGIALAKAKRGHGGGRPRVDPGSLDAAVSLYADGQKSVSEISRITGVSRSSLYRELRERGVERS